MAKQEDAVPAPPCKAGGCLIFSYEGSNAQSLAFFPHRFVMPDAVRSGFGEASIAAGSASREASSSS